MIRSHADVLMLVLFGVICFCIGGIFQHWEGGAEARVVIARLRSRVAGCVRWLRVRRNWFMEKR